MTGLKPIAAQTDFSTGGGCGKGPNQILGRGSVTTQLMRHFQKESHAIGPNDLGQGTGLYQTTDLKQNYSAKRASRTRRCEVSL